MVPDGFMACGLADTLLSACVWWCLGDHCVEVVWGALRGRKGKEAQKEPDVSSLGIWLDSDVINQHVKSKRWKSRFGGEDNEFNSEYVGRR